MKSKHERHSGGETFDDCVCGGRLRISIRGNGSRFRPSATKNLLMCTLASLFDYYYFFFLESKGIFELEIVESMLFIIRTFSELRKR